MKKYRYICVVAGLLLVIAIIATYALTSSKINVQEKDEQCRSIYTEIQNETFFDGKWMGNTVFLYDENFREIKQLPVEYSPGRKSVRIVKDFNQIRFVLRGAVDDECGIVFVKGATVDMSGIYLLKRLSGNSYYYETRQ